MTPFQLYYLIANIFIAASFIVIDPVSKGYMIIMSIGHFVFAFKHPLRGR